MISLSDLKAKRSAMTEAGTPWCVQGPWPQATIYVDNAAIEDDSIHPTHVATMAASVLNGQSTTDDPDATGIVATHNAADVLIEIAESASVVLKMFDDPNTDPWWGVAGADARFALREALAKVRP